MLAGRRPRSHDAIEVLDVLRDQCPLVGSREAEEILVGHCRQAGIVGRSEHVVVVLTKTIRGNSGVVNVEQKPHPASSRWRRCQVASASSAAATLAATSASISTGNAA